MKGVGQLYQKVRAAATSCTSAPYPRQFALPTGGIYHGLGCDFLATTAIATGFVVKSSVGINEKMLMSKGMPYRAL
jgi:hypothetical protein